MLINVFKKLANIFDISQQQHGWITRGLGLQSKRPPQIRKLSFIKIIGRIIIRRTRRILRKGRQMWVQPSEKSGLTKKKFIKGLKIGTFSGLCAIIGLSIYKIGSPPPNWRFQDFEKEILNMPELSKFSLRLLKEFQFYSQLFLFKPKSRLLPSNKVWFCRVKTRCEGSNGSMQDEGYLVPKEISGPQRIPPECLTVVIELRDLLVHLDHSLLTGWRFKKRPGLDSLLEFLNDEWRCEIIIYTNEHPEVAFEVINQLEKGRNIQFRVIAGWPTWLESEGSVKRLEVLNRPLSRTIAIDTEHGEPISNFIVIPPWKGDLDDRMLYELKNFLNKLLEIEEEDVRHLIGRFSTSGNTLREYQLSNLSEQQKKEEDKQTNLE